MKDLSAERMIAPPIASSSGVRPAATSFCIELRMPEGSDSSRFKISRQPTTAPSAIATAHTSPMAASSRARQMEWPKIPCLFYSLAVPTSASGARKASFSHSMVFSSARNSQEKPASRRRAATPRSLSSPIVETVKLAKAER